MELQLLVDRGAFGKWQAQAAELWCIHCDWSKRGAFAIIELSDLTNPPQDALREAAATMGTHVVTADDLQQMKHDAYASGVRDGEARARAAGAKPPREWWQEGMDILALKAENAELKLQLTRRSDAA